MSRRALAAAAGAAILLFSLAACSGGGPGNGDPGATGATDPGANPGNASGAIPEDDCPGDGDDFRREVLYKVMTEDWDGSPESKGPVFDGIETVSTCIELWPNASGGYPYAYTAFIPGDLATIEAQLAGLGYVAPTGDPYYFGPSQGITERNSSRGDGHAVLTYYTSWDVFFEFYINEFKGVEPDTSIVIDGPFGFFQGTSEF